MMQVCEHERCGFPALISKKDDVLVLFQIPDRFVTVSCQDYAIHAASKHSFSFRPSVSIVFFLLFLTKKKQPSIVFLSYDASSFSVFEQSALTS